MWTDLNETPLMYKARAECAVFLLWDICLSPPLIQNVNSSVWYAFQYMSKALSINVIIMNFVWKNQRNMNSY